jgi:hypothetical protein
LEVKQELKHEVGYRSLNKGSEIKDFGIQEIG